MMLFLCPHLFPNPHSYVLLHHVMGELEGVRNAWAYVEGGMGSVSMAIAKAALSHGAAVYTESVSLLFMYAGNI